MKNFLNLFKLLRQKNKFSNERKQIQFDDKYEFLNELSDNDLITLLTITHTTLSHSNTNNEIFNDIMNDQSKNASFKQEHQEQIRKVIRIRAEILEYTKSHNND
jgi:aspartate/tyrosine/aromatic aminotransferase